LYAYGTIFGVFGGVSKPFRPYLSILEQFFRSKTVYLDC